MSEERSELATGLTPGKRPLDITTDPSADIGDSSIAPKRLKVGDGTEEHGITQHSGVSNGEIDSPSQNVSPASNGDDNHIGDGDRQSEPQPKYVLAADEERDAHRETNGSESNAPSPSVDSNSQDSLAFVSSIQEKNDSKDNGSNNSENRKTEENPSSDTQVAEVDLHTDKSCNKFNSDIDTRTENSGSINGGSEAKLDGDSSGDKASKESLQEQEDKDSVEHEKDEEKSAISDSAATCSKGGEGNSEEMDVDSVTNADGADSDIKEKESEKTNEGESSKPCIVCDTSVPRGSSTEAESVKEGEIDENKMDTSEMETEECAKEESHDTEGKISDSKDLSKNIDVKGSSKLKGSSEEDSSERDGITASSAKSDDLEDKENKTDPYLDCLKVLSSEQDEARTVIIKKLHEELRNEETKLLLLKKLRLSQQQPVAAPVKPDAAAVAAATMNGTVPPSVNAHGGQRPGGNMSMTHSAISGSKPHASIQPQSNSSHRSDMPQLMRGTHIQRQMQNYQKAHSGPPPLIMNQSSRMSSSPSGQLPVRAPVVRISSGQSSSTSTSSISRQPQQQSRQKELHDGQSAASRQAAAKLALRKQLEKTLLQIPPPKPPPPELHFLPSAANNEFVILVGLEEVVNTILDMDNKDKNQSKGFVQPFKCSQCNTDFTTIWKQVKQDPKQGTMCEACIVSNQKKALKAEHTNRLKTAFVKALQQEQEIEQRIQQSQSSSQHRSSGSSSNSQQRHRPPAIVHHSSHSSSHGSSIHRPVSSSSQQQKQRVMNPAPSRQVVAPLHYAYIPNLPVSAPQIQIIPKQHMLAAQRSSADRQREYLLDMIPSKGLGHPQNPVIWKR